MTQPAIPRRIVLAGWYGRDNAGDEAILRQFMAELPPSEALQLTILAHNQERIYTQYAGPHVSTLQHHRMTDRPALKHWLRGRFRPLIEALRQSDMLVVGGGSLIHDNSGLRSLIPVIDDMLIAQHYGRQVWLYSVGIGPLRSKMARRIAGHALRRCHRLTVRDRGSVDLLLELGVDPKRITLVKDPVFRLQPQQPAPGALATLGAAEGQIGVFLKDALGLPRPEKRRLIQWLAAELDALHTTHNLRFMLVPMMTHPEDDDRLTAQAVTAAMTHKNAVTILGQPLPPEQLMWLAGRCQAVIAIRLHAAIFALAQAVPAVAIGYDPKVDNLMHDTGLSDYLVPMYPPQDGTLHTATTRLLANHETLSRDLTSRLEQNRQEAGIFFDLMRSELKI
jgi:polysaccharide pyruvyl transferase CsaB